METALLLFLLMGLVLGLVGSGGSILTLPILVYGLGMDPVPATAYSLFIVGLTALAGSVDAIRSRAVDFGALVRFGLPSVLAVYATRLWLLPALPETLGTVPKGTALLLLFALLMVAAAVAMWRGRSEAAQRTVSPGTAWKVPAEGIGVGVLTGLVGAGGGFLIVPALTLLGGLGMRVAVGTSLLLIFFKSALGFVGDLQAGLSPDWGLLLLLTAAAVPGILLGGRLSAHISGTVLRRVFAGFVLLMAIYITYTELL